MAHVFYGRRAAVWGIVLMSLNRRGVCTIPTRAKRALLARVGGSGLLLKAQQTRYHHHHDRIQFDDEMSTRKLLTGLTCVSDDGTRRGTVDIQQEPDSDVAVLTLNNGARMNALSGEMMVQFYDHIKKLETWTSGKGLVLHGADSTFCSGGELGTVMALNTPGLGHKMSCWMHRCMMDLFYLPLVSVALIEGRALGGGAEITTACDFRLITPGSEIRFVHAHMGLIPGWGGTSRLVKLVGRRVALELLTSARKVKPDEALALGLVDGIVPEGVDPLLYSKDWLKKHTHGAVEVVRNLKNVVARAADTDDIFSALEYERDCFKSVWAGPAAKGALARNLKHR